MNMLLYRTEGTLQVWLSEWYGDGEIILGQLFKEAKYNHRVLIREKQVCEIQKKELWWWEQRLEWCALKIEEGAVSQGIQVASGNWKSQRKPIFHWSLHKECSLMTTSFWLSETHLGLLILTTAEHNLFYFKPPSSWALLQ